VLCARQPWIPHDRYAQSRASARAASEALRAAGAVAAGGGERARREERVELLRVPLGVAGSRHDLGQDLFAPLPDLRLDYRVGAGNAAIPAAVCDQVRDRAEVGVDGKLVSTGVVAGGLVFEITRRPGCVAR